MAQRATSKVSAVASGASAATQPYLQFLSSIKRGVPKAGPRSSPELKDAPRRAGMLAIGFACRKKAGNGRSSANKSSRTKHAPRFGNGHERPCNSVRGFDRFLDSKYLIFWMFLWSRGESHSFRADRWPTCRWCAAISVFDSRVSASRTIIENTRNITCVVRDR